MIIDIGSGPHPEPTADIVIDKYLDGDGTSRGNSDLKILPHQKFIQADICKLPFEDKEVDYVYTKHILEHVDYPCKACKEIMRVGKAGYIETPTSLWETLFGRSYHLWLMNLEDGELIFRRKKLETYKENTFDGDWLYSNVPEFKSMFHKNIDLFSVRLHWKDEFKFEVRY